MGEKEFEKKKKEERRTIKVGSRAPIGGGKKEHLGGI